MEKKKDLYQHRIASPESGKRIRFPLSIPLWDVSKEIIFIGMPEKEYEIWCFNMEGNLVRKIRKEYKTIEMPEDYKNRIKNILEQSEISVMKDSFYFPKYWPPYQFLFSDDNGRLFVMTYEKGENPKEFIFDVFNPEGFLIMRKSLRVFLSVNPFIPGSPLDSWVVMKNDRFYCLQENESGYKKLVVYKVKWE
jgi:hypothetical protein